MYKSTAAPPQGTWTARNIWENLCVLYIGFHGRQGGVDSRRSCCHGRVQPLWTDPPRLITLWPNHSHRGVRLLLEEIPCCLVTPHVMWTIMNSCLGGRLESKNKTELVWWEDQRKRWMSLWEESGEKNYHHSEIITWMLWESKPLVWIQKQKSLALHFSAH